jgi:hypothetical protein
MSLLLERLNISLTTLVNPDSTAKPTVEFAILDDSVFLKNELDRAKGVTADNFPDRTGLECFVNHVHLPYDDTQESLWDCLQYATGLRNQLGEFRKGSRFAVILSTSNDGCVVRFHQLRPNEGWLADDLEKYSEEGILVLTVGDL